MSDSEEKRPAVAGEIVEANKDGISINGLRLPEGSFAILSPASSEPDLDPSYLWTVEAAYDFAKAIQTPAKAKD